MNSIGTLYIDCPEQERKDAFDAKDISEDEYVKMLRDYSTTIGVGLPKSNNKHFSSYEYKEYKTEKVNYSKAKTKYSYVPSH